MSNCFNDNFVDAIFVSCSIYDVIKFIPATVLIQKPLVQTVEIAQGQQMVTTAKNGFTHTSSIS